MSHTPENPDALRQMYAPRLNDEQWQLFLDIGKAVGISPYPTEEDSEDVRDLL